jgi:outer membrane protein assembly factor BamB
MPESAIRPAPLLGAADGDGLLVALDARRGNKLWTRRLAAPPMGCATAARDVVFVPTYDGRMLALAAATGRALWQTRAHRDHRLPRDCPGSCRRRAPVRLPPRTEPAFGS